MRNASGFLVKKQGGIRFTARFETGEEERGPRAQARRNLGAFGEGT
jgi:hypothetical protein